MYLHSFLLPRRHTSPGNSNGSASSPSSRLSIGSMRLPTAISGGRIKPLQRGHQLGADRLGCPAQDELDVVGAPEQVHAQRMGRAFRPLEQQCRPALADHPLDNFETCNIGSASAGSRRRQPVRSGSSTNEAIGLLDRAARRTLNAQDVSADSTPTPRFIVAPSGPDVGERISDKFRPACGALRATPQIIEEGQGKPLAFN